MGRPVGSVNREKPFTDMLRVALLNGGGRRLRVIAEKLAEKAEQGDLRATQQIVDRLLYGGESGIRTHGTVSRTHAFQACALSHSAISPGALS
jgi:hypothetical protein